MEVLEQLQAAIQTGEVLTIVYNGGSQPGTTRQISPIKIEGAKVRARCFSSNAVKVFRLEKIEITERPTSNGYVDPIELPKFEDLDQVAEYYTEHFEKQGWTVESYPDAFLLFDHFKNGKPRKTPALSLTYDEDTSEIFWSGEEDDPFVSGKRQKPWSVTGRSQTFSAFKHLNKAMQKFLNLAANSSPSA